MFLGGIYTIGKCKNNQYINISIPMKRQQSPHNNRKIKILAISDTHVNHHLIDTSSWPQADIFIHAGDFTITSTRQQLADFRVFIKKLPYKHKIVIAGNHDFGLQQSQEVYERIAHQWQVPKNERINTLEEINKLKSVCTLLQHECITIEGLTIFGTPHVWNRYQMAFTGPKLKKWQIWNNLPLKLDVLVTHIPPFGILDKIHDNKQVGCQRLLNKVEEIKPKIHIFGHIHQSFGNCLIDQTHFYNVCYLNEHYDPKNRPILIQIEAPKLSNIK